MKTKYSNREIQGLLRPNYLKSLDEKEDSIKIYNCAIYSNIHPNLLKKFMLIEYWEQKDFSISSKVIAVCPIYATYDDNANYKGSIQLCWFLLEE